MQFLDYKMKASKSIAFASFRPPSLKINLYYYI